MCELILDFKENIPLNEPNSEIEGRGIDNFIIVHKLHSKSVYWVNVTMAYFAFTSLTTVGFGDYHPTQNIEYVVCAFLLLFGVLIFSYIINVFLDLLANYTLLH